MLRALLLDLGNVLVFHDNALLQRELARAFGVAQSTLAARLDAGLWDEVNRGRHPGDALRRELVRRLSGALGRDPGPEAFREAWSCHFEVNRPMVSAVERLVGRVRLVLVSNSNDLHIDYLRPRLPLLSRVDGFAFSHELGVAKPDAAIFEHALHLAGARPQEAAFFDDVAEYVQAAARVGIHARLFTSVPAFERELDSLISARSA
jgi:HAD superfamily hydrolase (TIGR01509 family)